MSHPTVVTYICPVCGTENQADARDAMVTCDNGHHLAIISEPDADARVQCEEIPDED